MCPVPYMASNLSSDMISHPKSVCAMRRDGAKLCPPACVRPPDLRRLSARKEIIPRTVPRRCVSVDFGAAVGICHCVKTVEQLLWPEEGEGAKRFCRPPKT